MKTLPAVSLVIVLLVSACPRGSAGQVSPSKQETVEPRRRVADEPPKLSPGEAAALADECGKRVTRMSAFVAYNYTYTQTDFEYELDKLGRVGREKSSAYEVYPVRGRPNVRVQLSEDGVPLSPERVERERKRAAEELTAAEERAAQAQSRQGTAAARPPSRRLWSLGIALTLRTSGGLGRLNLPIRPTDFLVSHEFYAPRRAVLGGREAVLLDFRPRAGFVFDRLNAGFEDGLEEFNRLMAQLGGRIWIDAADKVIARVEVAPVTESNPAGDAPNESAPLGFEYARLPNGVWVPSRSWLNAYGREKVFGKVAVVSRAHRYGDFKMFSTQVKDAVVEAPKP
jgi:hypothetical protein